MVYLLHFEPPYRHARHYLGYSDNPAARFERHLAGQGSRLVRAAVAAGCRVHVAWVREGDRSDERRLKNGKNAPKLCPLCKAETRE